MINRRFVLHPIIIGSTIIAITLACTCTSAPEPTSAPRPAATSAPAPTSVPAPTAVPTEPPTDAPTAEPTATEEPAVILYEDDFSDPDSGWEHYREFDGVLDYENGGYRMWVNAESNLFWVNAGQEYADARLEVDATKLDGPDANMFGVLCRYDNTSFAFYAFLISSDGKYGIAKRTMEGTAFLGSDGMQPSDAINQGAAVNHIRADCVGATLALYANGHKLIELEDDSLAQGDVGLAVGTVGEPGADILFDNFQILEP